MKFSVTPARADGILESPGLFLMRSPMNGICMKSSPARRMVHEN
jgi:hypothetical protein